MTTFNVHTKATAPQQAKQLLENAERAYGFVPNLLGVFAASPATLKAYTSLSRIFDESTLSAVERQVVLLAASRYGECHYCVAAHSTVADMQGIPLEVTEAIRNDEPIEDAKLETLRDFTIAVIEKRGWVSTVDVDAFISAGFTQAQVLEVVLGVGLKTISNYINHFADTPLDEAFAPREWRSTIDRKAS